MLFPLDTNEKPVLVTVEALALKPVKIRMVVSDMYKPNTIYTDRTHVLQKQRTPFKIQLPQTPKQAVLRIDAIGDANGAGLRIIPPKFSELQKGLPSKFLPNHNVKKMIKFAQWFCENAGVLSANDSIYMSDDLAYRIDYKNMLPNPDGNPSSTPTRISINTGVIEWNRSRCVGYPVPIRMILTLHELSHCYINKNASNEFEADLNAFFLYLGMGYPTVDGLTGWAEVFKYSAPNVEHGKYDKTMNEKRWAKMKEFADNYEKKPFKILYN